jgi:hypothetical protein
MSCTVASKYVNFVIEGAYVNVYVTASPGSDPEATLTVEGGDGKGEVGLTFVSRALIERLSMEVPAINVPVRRLTYYIFTFRMDALGGVYRSTASPDDYLSFRLAVTNVDAPQTIARGEDFMYSLISNRVW